jgi:hypothetical protein
VKPKATPFLKSYSKAQAKSKTIRKQSPTDYSKENPHYEPLDLPYRSHGRMLSTTGNPPRTISYPRSSMVHLHGRNKPKQIPKKTAQGYAAQYQANTGTPCTSDQAEANT